MIRLLEKIYKALQVLVYYKKKKKMHQTLDSWLCFPRHKPLCFLMHSYTVNFEYQDLHHQKHSRIDHIVTVELVDINCVEFYI